MRSLPTYQESLKQLRASNPDFYVRRFVPGEPVDDARMGDFVLVHGDHFTSKLIRFGQRLRFRGDRKVYSYWSHAVLCHGGSVMSEANAPGVERGDLSKYDHKDVYLVRVDASDEDRGQMRRFAESVLRERWAYDRATFVSLALYFLTGTKLILMRAASAVCSGYVSEDLTRAGFIWPRPPGAMTPAHLAEYFHVNRKPAEVKR